jgi:hypothetical protein
MRSHDRGGSAGGCNNKPSDAGAYWTPGCWIVEPWNVENTYFEANRAALQLREELVPYIFTAHRNAFDTGAEVIADHGHVGHGGGCVQLLAINLLGQRAVGVQLGCPDGEQSLLCGIFVVLNADHCVARGHQSLSFFDQRRDHGRGNWWGGGFVLSNQVQGDRNAPCQHPRCQQGYGQCFGGGHFKSPEADDNAAKVLRI